MRRLFKRFREPPLEFARKSFVALLANRFQIHLVKLRFWTHLLVADGAGEVLRAPAFVECLKNISGDNAVAHETHVAKQLMVMRLAVG